MRELNLTAPEAAKLAKVSMPTMYEWLNSEGFPAFRVGKKWLIPIRAFEAWLEQKAAERAGTHQ